MSVPLLRLAWLAFQATAAATIAWLVANLVHADTQPFFAPVAAVIALTAPRGQRGTKAIQLLLGVGLGIVIGEVIVLMMGAGYGRVALAAFASLFLAGLLGEARVTLTQAGASAVLTVIAAEGDAGWQRLFDAAIGGAVALAFTQVVFSPEPVALLRRAEGEALASVARGLAKTADALERGDAHGTTEALEALRSVRDRLVELARVRKASANVARHSALWQSQREAARRERDHADAVDLFASGCIMLARTAFGLPEQARRLVGERIGELAAAVDELAKAPGVHAVRRRAAECAARAARPLGLANEATEPALVASASILRIAAADIIVFAGVAPAVATAAVLSGSGELDVPTPPDAPLLPFGLERRRDNWRGFRGRDIRPAERSDGPPTQD